MCIYKYKYEWPYYLAYGWVNFHWNSMYGWMVNHLREPVGMPVWNKIRSCDSILKKPACSPYLQNAMEINWGQPSGQTHAFLCNLERLWCSIEIMDLPIKNGRPFHNYVNVYQAGYSWPLSIWKPWHMNEVGHKAMTHKMELHKLKNSSGS